MIYGSVCSGIEAATVAWHPLGWHPAFFSEIDPFPRAVLAHHYPSVPLHGDFTTIQPGDYAAIDLLVGGTPCQSFSVAGLRGGLADDRGNLALEFLRLADRLRPRWLVWENVPGVLSSNGGRDFGSILGGMVELGYGFAYRVLDAQHVRTQRFPRAVPQRRRRVFVVGHLGDWRAAAAVLFERDSLSGNPAPRREAGQGIAVCPTLRAGGNRTGGDRPPGTDVDTCDSLIAAPDVARCDATREGSSQDWESTTMVAHALRGTGFDASEDGTGRGTLLVPVGVDLYNQSVTGDVAATLSTTGGGPLSGPSLMSPIAFHPTQDPISSEGVVHALGTGSAQGCATAAIAFRADALREGNAKTPSADAEGRVRLRDPGMGMYEELAPTLDTGAAHAVAFDPAQITSRANRTRVEPGLPASTLAKQSRMHVAFDLRGREGGAVPEGPHDTANIRAASGGSSRSYLAAPMHVRRLTPRECERLQGFPDDWTIVPYRGKDAADGPRYKAIGNSMAVNVMDFIGQRIDAVEALLQAREKAA